MPEMPPPLEKDRVVFFQRVATLYVRYVQIFRRLESVYDQMVHPQKRRILRQLLDGVIGRVLELKNEMVEKECSEYHYMDDIVQDLKLTPADIEIPIPKYFINERTKVLHERGQILSAILDRMGLQTKPKALGPQHIQPCPATVAARSTEEHRQHKQGEHERDYQMALVSVKDKLREVEGPDMRETMKDQIRQWFIECQHKMPSNKVGCKTTLMPALPALGPQHIQPCPATVAARSTEEHRQHKQGEHERDYQMALVSVKDKLREVEGPDMRETMKDQIRQWFIECHDLTGTFPEYPDEEDGGSAVIFAEKTPKQNRDESTNFNQKHVEELIKEEKRKEIESEIRVQVDELMREELKNLRLAVDRDSGTKGKSGKKKKKGKKSGKKKKKEKDLTPDRTIQSLYQELVEQGILKQAEKVTLDEYLDTVCGLKHTCSKSSCLAQQHCGGPRWASLSLATRGDCEPVDPYHTGTEVTDPVPYRYRTRTEGTTPVLSRCHSCTDPVLKSPLRNPVFLGNPAPAVSRLMDALYRLHDAEKLGLANFPPVEASIAALVQAPNLALLSTKDTACPNKQCRIAKIVSCSAWGCLANDPIEVQKIHFTQSVFITSCKSDYSYLGTTLRQTDIEPMPSLSDVRQVVSLYAVLPLGSSFVHEKAPLVKSILLAGPAGVGKKMLVNAICTETGANLFDLSPMNIAGKYPGKNGLQMMLHLVFKVARQLQPSVVWIGEAEKMFYKKVPKDEKELDPKRLKKDLPKILKSIKGEDRVLIVGTSKQPFNGDLKPLCKAYNKIILIPRPDYASRYVIWAQLIQKNGGVITSALNLSSLAKISDGYTQGHIMKVVKAVLTERRIDQLAKKPLTGAEYVVHLAKIDPVFKEEEEAFKSWYAKTPLGKKRAMAALGKNEEEVEKGKEKGKGGKKQK
ncbi:UNVERIFIED_CONTAM: hypothetical protein FKN15_046324 [Acipenser sinensis]